MTSSPSDTRRCWAANVEINKKYPNQLFSGDNCRTDEYSINYSPLKKEVSLHVTEFFMLIPPPDAFIEASSKILSARKQSLRTTERLTWGVVVRAHWRAYSDHCDRTHIGTVVCFDHPGDSRYDLMAALALAEIIRSIRYGMIELPLSGLFLDFLEGSESREATAMRVPEELVGDARAWALNIPLERRDLPAGFLAKRVLPIVLTDNPNEARVASAEHWSRELLDYWDVAPGDLIDDEQTWRDERLLGVPIVQDTLDQLLDSF